MKNLVVRQMKMYPKLTSTLSQYAIPISDRSFFPLLPPP